MIAYDNPKLMSYKCFIFYLVFLIASKKYIIAWCIDLNVTLFSLVFFLILPLYGSLFIFVIFQYHFLGPLLLSNLFTLNFNIQTRGILSSIDHGLLYNGLKKLK